MNQIGTLELGILPLSWEEAEGGGPAPRDEVSPARADGDDDALELARAGNAEAYERVYRNNAPRLLRRAMALTRNPALAKELTADTLSEAWRVLPRYNGSCAFFTWLSSILRNRYCNFLRDNRMLRSGPVDFESLLSLPNTSPAPCPDRAAEAEDVSWLLRRCVEALPDKQRQVIQLRFFSGETLETIASALQCPVGTIKSRLHHALRNLRAMEGLQAEFFGRKGNGILFLFLLALVCLIAPKPAMPRPEQQARHSVAQQITERTPTLAVYQAAAQHSVDDLNELLNKEGNKRLPRTPSYTLFGLQGGTAGL
ncbi:MAG TPA: sigma-70 family RNA polymerase sigma factor [Candidatus Dormibacteraeota bacterium]|nr:sigma-70 family RNA polymerase sigma factor [Candidatus Dormibacteraeota bacterium]